MSVGAERQLIYSGVDYQHSETVLAGLYRQFTMGTHCDLTVNTNDGKIRTHGCLVDILFTKALVSNNQTTGHLQLDVGDFDQSAILPLVEMMYTGTLSIVPAMVNCVQDAAVSLGYEDAERGCRFYMSIQDEQTKAASKSSTSKHPEILIKEEPPDYDDYSTENSLHTSVENNNNNNCRFSDNVNCNGNRNTYIASSPVFASNKSWRNYQKPAVERSSENVNSNNFNFEGSEQSEYCSNLNLMRHSSLSYVSPSETAQETSRGRRTRSRSIRNSVGSKVSNYADLDENDIDKLMEDDECSAKTYISQKSMRLVNTFRKHAQNKAKYCAPWRKGVGGWHDKSSKYTRVCAQQASKYKLPGYITGKDSVQHIMIASEPKQTVHIVVKERDKDPEYLPVTPNLVAQLTCNAKPGRKVTEDPEYLPVTTNQAAQLTCTVKPGHEVTNQAAQLTCTAKPRREVTNQAAQLTCTAKPGREVMNQAAQLTCTAKPGRKGTDKGLITTKRYLRERKPSTDKAAEVNNLKSKVDDNKEVTTGELPFSRVHNHHGINFKYTYSKKEIKVKKNWQPAVKAHQPSVLIEADELNKLLYGDSYKSTPEENTGSNSRKRKLRSEDSTIGEESRVKDMQGLDTLPSTDHRSLNNEPVTSTCSNLKITDPLTNAAKHSLLTDTEKEPCVRLPSDKKSNSEDVSRSCNVPKCSFLIPDMGLTGDEFSDTDSDSSSEPIEVPSGMKYIPDVGLVSDRRDGDGDDDDMEISEKILGITRKKLFLSHINKQRAENQPKYVICHPNKPVVKP